MKKDIAKLLQFYTFTEKLKTTMRHSWLSDSARQESSAEHSWMLALLACVLFDYASVVVNQLHVLKMVIIHDLAEAVTGDIPVFEKSKRQRTKHEKEQEAFLFLGKYLPKKTAKEFLTLWEEFEEEKTIEAKFARAIDTVEALMQHHIADISTWSDGDYSIAPYYKEEAYTFDTFFKELKTTVDTLIMEKIDKADMLDKIDTQSKDRYLTTKHKKSSIPR